MRASAVTASGSGPPNGAAVLGDRQHVDPDLALGDAADARADRGHARAVVAAVGDHRDVGPQQVGVAPHEVGEVLGRALLLALDERS